MVEYSTLEEAYPNDEKNLRKNKLKLKESKEQINERINNTKDIKDTKNTKETKEKFINDYGNEQDCYYSSYMGINSPTCPKIIKNPQIDTFKNNENCKPLQAPEYKLPIDSNSIKNYQKAIKSSLLDTGFVDDFKKDGVKPYDFDEMDAYLHVSNIKTNNKDSTPEYRTTPFLQEYLMGLRENFKKPLSKSYDKYPNIEQFTNNNNNKNIANNFKVDVNLYNLFLFIFLGIIIILLIDQITKLTILSANN
jgi:hypothetical protein